MILLQLHRIYIYKIREQVNILYAHNEKALKALNICLKYLLDYGKIHIVKYKI